ncbi:MAG: CPBP family intramembrane glutamic endopeptidase [Candidatus Eiseniibacteriota bacterium]
MIFFTVAVFALTCAVVFPLRGIPPEIIAGTPWLFPMIALAGYTPALAGVFAAGRESGGAGVAELLRRLVPRPGDAAWIAAAAVLPLAVGIGAGALSLAWGEAAGPIEPGGLAVFAPLLAQKLVLSGLGEEIGWRGFALPRLQRRLHPLAASVLLAGLTAAWHWLRGDSFPLHLAAVLPLTIVLSFAYNVTRGSLLVCAMLAAALHAATGALERTVPLLWLNGVADFPVTAAWAWIAVVLIGFTRGRLGLSRAA